MRRPSLGVHKYAKGGAMPGYCAWRAKAGRFGTPFAIRLFTVGPSGAAFTAHSDNRNATMSLETLADAFHDELRDVLSAERQLVKALPKMVKAATDPQLKKAIESHLAETETHVQRVEQAFEDTGKAPRAKTCEAMKGLLEEGSSLLEEDAAPEVLDALIIAAAQKVEHYEIATYGTLCTWAEVLGYNKALKVLKQNMAQEEAADEKLSKIAETVNAKAAEGAMAE